MRYIIYVALCLALSICGVASDDFRTLTPSDIIQLEQAIQDEVYDYGYYTEYYQIGENKGTSQHWIAELHVFVNQKYNTTDKHGEVIYKLMPYGQIYRLFYIGQNGQVRLDGDPQNHFPITQPSRQTVFMNELEICKLEQSWNKASFVIDTAPTREMIEGAARRQKERTGFSDWEYEHHTKD